MEPKENHKGGSHIPLGTRPFWDAKTYNYILIRGPWAHYITLNLSRGATLLWPQLHTMSIVEKDAAAPCTCQVAPVTATY